MDQTLLAATPSVCTAIAREITMGQAKHPPTFVDLCAGCGGLSLGLMNAGWKGLFAVEKNEDAFKTLKFNLLGDRKKKFFWPDWLPEREISLEDLTAKHAARLKELRGTIDLLAGGPPCQGFSTFGRRSASDPRNQIFRQYLKVVELLQPKMVLMENVRGILCPFKGEDAPKDENGKPLVYADIIKEALNNEYEVSSKILHAKEFGVPQNRPRFILVGIRKELIAERGPSIETFFDSLAQDRRAFLESKDLYHTHPTVHNAISDLISVGGAMHECLENPRFQQGAYGKQTTNYQRLMHGDLNGAIADSHRFARHKPTTVEKFECFQLNCTRGRKITQEERGKYANKKHTVCVLHPNQPAPTVTTLPDDMIHYDEPRILTVREMARLQSFPDWFHFKGKYTTGGDRRTKECPRYTQVGNAVPPLLAEAIGRTLLDFKTKVSATLK
jgi:DNA (cytosine-5)-methyltransferase 1